MKTEISLNSLSQNFVTILTTKVLEDRGISYKIPPHAKAYINSEKGRLILKQEVTDPYLSAILNVWGETPTVQENQEITRE